MLFFPSFLLGAGGPPPLGDGRRCCDRSADVLPLTWVTKSIREPWLGIGTPVLALVLVAALAVVADGVRRAPQRALTHVAIRT